MVRRYRRIKIVEKSVDHDNIHIIYPQVKLYKDRKREIKINKLIANSMDDFIKEEIGDKNDKALANASYDVKLNANGLLSIIFEASSSSNKVNQNFTAIKSITLDTRKSSLINLGDLFVENSYYDFIINKIITDSIEADETPHLQEFLNIKHNECFYLTEDSLVSYIPLYKDTRYANSYCTPEFKIPLRDIKVLLNPKCPAKRLALYA